MDSFGYTVSFRASLAIFVLCVCCLNANGQRVERDRKSTAAATGKETTGDKPAAGADVFSGEWIYRSFISTPTLSDETKPLDQLLFGQGNLKIKVSDAGKVTGTLGGEGWELKLTGTTQVGDPSMIKFQGKGTIGGEEWIYDYLGYAVPKWPNGIDQRPAIVGIIVRTVPHSDGKAQAGYVAQWIAVHQIDEDEVRQLENGWVEAVKANDADKIDRFLVDYFSFIDPNQNVQTREQHLDDFRTGKLKVTAMRIQKISINLNETTANATVSASVEGTYDGRDIAGVYDFQDTWLLVQGRLRAVVRTQTKVEMDGSVTSNAVDPRSRNIVQPLATSMANATSNCSSVAALASAITGKKSVLLFVKGSFCPHCMSQVSMMSDELTGRDVSVFVVSASTDDDLKDFPQASYHLIADPELEIFKAYGAFDGKAKHATIVLDDNGRELFRDVNNEPLLETAPVIRAVESFRAVSAASVK